jgi:hypothetical protein
MRGINIYNDKKRDAKVAFQPYVEKSEIKMVLPDGREKQNIRVVKTTTCTKNLVKQYGSLENVGEAIADSDPEINIETTGSFINKTHKLYLTPKGEISYRLERLQIVYDPQGNEKERLALSSLPANINTAIPLQWTGREYPRQEVIRRFVFTRNYQLRHTSGLSYDFLYDMAKQLHERDVMMLLGAGKKGSEPLVLSLGGTPYRGFLEGRIEDLSYALILHLSNMELRGL